MKRFKGLDLVDRVPEELWMEVCNTVKKAVIKNIPMKKKCKKAKWLSEEALQIAVKRRDEKGKGEKEKYIHLKAQFLLIARRDKIVLYSAHLCMKYLLGISKTSSLFLLYCFPLFLCMIT